MAAIEQVPDTLSDASGGLEFTAKGITDATTRSVLGEKLKNAAIFSYIDHEPLRNKSGKLYALRVTVLAPGSSAPQKIEVQPNAVPKFLREWGAEYAPLFEGWGFFVPEIAPKPKTLPETEAPKEAPERVVESLQPRNRGEVNAPRGMHLLHDKADFQAFFDKIKGSQEAGNKVFDLNGQNLRLSISELETSIKDGLNKISESYPEDQQPEFMWKKAGGVVEIWQQDPGKAPELILEIKASFIKPKEEPAQEAQEPQSEPEVEQLTVESKPETRGKPEEVYTQPYTPNALHGGFRMDDVHFVRVVRHSQSGDEEQEVWMTAQEAETRDFAADFKPEREQAARELRENNIRDRKAVVWVTREKDDDNSIFYRIDVRAAKPDDAFPSEQAISESWLSIEPVSYKEFKGHEGEVEVDRMEQAKQKLDEDEYKRFLRSASKLYAKENAAIRKLVAEGKPTYEIIAEVTTRVKDFIDRIASWNVNAAKDSIARAERTQASKVEFTNDQFAELQVIIYNELKDFVDANVQLKGQDQLGPWGLTTKKSDRETQGKGALDSASNEIIKKAERFIDDNAARLIVEQVCNSVKAYIEASGNKVKTEWVNEQFAQDFRGLFEEEVEKYRKGFFSSIRRRAGTLPDAGASKIILEQAVKASLIETAVEVKDAKGNPIKDAEGNLTTELVYSREAKDTDELSRLQELRELLEEAVVYSEVREYDNEFDSIMDTLEDFAKKKGIPLDRNDKHEELEVELDLLFILVSNLNNQNEEALSEKKKSEKGLALRRQYSQLLPFLDPESDRFVLKLQEEADNKNSRISAPKVTMAEVEEVLKKLNQDPKNFGDKQKLEAIKEMMALARKKKKAKLEKITEDISLMGEKLRAQLIANGVPKDKVDDIFNSQEFVGRIQTALRDQLLQSGVPENQVDEALESNVFVAPHLLMLRDHIDTNIMALESILEEKARISKIDPVLGKVKWEEPKPTYISDADKPKHALLDLATDPAKLKALELRLKPKKATLFGVKN